MKTPKSASSPEHQDRASSRIALLILFAIVSLNSLDRQIVNILAQDIKLDLSLSDAELGLLTGTAFGLLKAIFSIPVASFADRSNRTRVLAAHVGLSGFFSMLCGATASFGWLVVGRMGVGVGESGTVPVAAALVREHSPARATSGLALVMAGTPVGAFFAFLLGGAIADHWGWRWAFLLAGAPGLLLAWIVLVRLKSVSAPQLRQWNGSVWISDVDAFMRAPHAKALICATSSSMFLVSAGNAWIPTLLIRTHGLTTSEAGLYAAIAFGIGGGLGAASGTACDGVRRVVAQSESILMLGSLILAAPFLFITVLSHSTALAIAGYFCFSFLTCAWLAPTIRLIQDVTGPHGHALAIAVCSAVGIAVALGVGVPLIGWLGDVVFAAYGERSISLSLALTLSIAIALGLATHFYLLFSLRRLAFVQNA